MRQPDAVAERVVEIAFPEAGAAAYCMTFG
ncbi:hypothetical protein [Kitasatospora herbaricolor]